MDPGQRLRLRLTELLAFWREERKIMEDRVNAPPNPPSVSWAESVVPPDPATRPVVMSRPAATVPQLTSVDNSGAT